MRIPVERQYRQHHTQHGNRYQGKNIVANAAKQRFYCPERQRLRATGMGNGARSRIIQGLISP
ncbi:MULTISPECIES: hypothetical protein [unclassified Janthinobacterium]|uniref:hypothetical protein n=1 Tax=unclassified Janthinobacterium TaxID=2610881 RepID=UPI001113BE6F|nr:MULTISPECIES: hypothetical protein [unclassified Janthinobacterium]